MPRAESGRHQLEITAGIFFFGTCTTACSTLGGKKNLYLLIFLPSLFFYFATF